MWAWLKDNHAPFSAIVGLLTLGGLVVAIVSLHRTESAVQANMMYWLQKDAREMTVKVYSDPEIEEYILAETATPNADEALVDRAEALMHEMVRFYAMVERIQTFGYVESSYWTHTKKEICGFQKLPNLKDFWDKRVVGGRYRDSFKELANDC